MLSIYRLTLRQLSSPGRVGIMLVLAIMPVVIAAVVLADNDTMSLS